MKKSELDKLISLVEDDGIDTSDLEIPQLEERSNNLTKRVMNFISERKEERELPWLKRSREKIDKFSKIGESVSISVEEAKKYITDLLAGKGDFGSQNYAAQFFREKDSEKLSDEEILSFYRDLKILEELSKEEKK